MMNVDCIFAYNENSGCEDWSIDRRNQECKDRFVVLELHRGRHCKDVKSNQQE